MSGTQHHPSPLDEFTSMTTFDTIRLADDDDLRSLFTKNQLFNCEPVSYSSRGPSLFHLVAKFGSFESLQILLKGLVRSGTFHPLDDGKKAKIRKLMNLPDEHGRTCLHSAVQRQRSDLAKAFVQLGARMDAHDNFKQTPIHIAAGTDALMLAVLMTLAAHSPKCDLRTCPGPGGCEWSYLVKLKDCYRRTAHDTAHLADLPECEKLLKASWDAEAVNAIAIERKRQEEKRDKDARRRRLYGASASLVRSVTSGSSTNERSV